MAEQILTIADFIKQTIIQVTNGLHDAQEEVRSKGTQIFPDSYGNPADSKKPRHIPMRDTGQTLEDY